MYFIAETTTVLSGLCIATADTAHRQSSYFNVNVLWHLVARRGIARLEYKTSNWHLRRRSDENTWTIPGSYSEPPTFVLPCNNLHPTALSCRQISPESSSPAVATNDGSWTSKLVSKVSWLRCQKRNSSTQCETHQMSPHSRYVWLDVENLVSWLRRITVRPARISAAFMGAWHESATCTNDLRLSPSAKVFVAPSNNRALYFNRLNDVYFIFF